MLSFPDYKNNACWTIKRSKNYPWSQQTRVNHKKSSLSVYTVTAHGHVGQLWGHVSRIVRLRPGPGGADRRESSRVTRLSHTDHTMPGVHFVPPCLGPLGVCPGPSCVGPWVSRPLPVRLLWVYGLLFCLASKLPKGRACGSFSL